MKNLNKIINYIKENYLVVILVVILLIVGGRFIYNKMRNDHFAYNATGTSQGGEPLYKTQGNFYAPRTGARKAEFKTDCLNINAQSCMMTDGTMGNCIMGGMCEPSFSQDHIRNDYLNPKPFCTPPRDMYSCTDFCKCMQMEQMQLGDYTFDVDKCIRESQSFFLE